MTDIHVYDTTLRDGAQQEGLNLSVADKLAIAAAARRARGRLHRGRLAGREPQGHRVLRRAAAELDLRNATLAAFGATRRAGVPRRRRPAGRARCATAGRPVVTLVAKSHDRHVELALRTTLEENLAMVRDTVSATCAARAGGSSSTPSTSSTATAPTATTRSRCCGRRTEAGAEVVALCDTNGGMLPDWVADVVARRRARPPASRVGIHCHNDTGCAVANTLAAVDAGATHVQGTINGYGERTGNADLLTVVANLELKLGRPVLPERHCCRRRPGSRTRSPRSPTCRRTRASRTSARRRSRTRPACTRARSRSTPTSTSTWTRRPSATTCGCWSPTWPAAPRSSSRAASSASTSSGDTRPGRPGHRPGQGAGGARLHLRGRRRVVRAAAARGGRRARGRRTSTSSRGGSSPTPAADDEARLRGHGQAASPAASGSSSPARATARSTRSTRRCAQALGAGLPGGRASSS